MREGISNDPPGTNSRIVRSDAIRVTIGLSVLLLAGEWFAALDACVADPSYNVEVPPAPTEAHFGMMVAGIALAVIGVAIAFVERRCLPRRAMIPRL
jgi:hypothetical protein